MPPATRPQATAATKLLLKVIVYYALLIAAGALVWRELPRTQIISQDSLNAIFGAALPTGRVSKGTLPEPVEQSTLAVTVILAMLSASLLALPVAWVYQLTRAKRGYQQSVVQLFIVLPVLIAGIVVLVKSSLPLAFSLAGIVAAVRFRNTLEDTKDAVYVFLAVGLGLASAVDVPVAALISIGFNGVILAMWYTDFGHAPVELEGRMAQRRLERAQRMANTGTFVAQMDEQLFQNMTAEQLESIARRATRRATQHMPRQAMGDQDGEVHLRVRTRDTVSTRRVLEEHLDDNVKRWRFEQTSPAEDGTAVLHYVVKLKKSRAPADLLTLVRTSCAPEVVDAELV